MHRLNRFLLILVSLLSSMSSASALAQSVVCFPRVTGPKPAGRGPAAKGLIEGLNNQGIEALRGPALREAAEEMGLSIYTIEVARVVDCDYLATVRLEGRSGRYVAVGEMRRVQDGSTVATVQRRYKSKKGATAAGRKVGEAFAKAILKDEGDGMGAMDTPPVPAVPVPAPVVPDEPEPIEEVAELPREELPPPRTEGKWRDSVDLKIDDEPRAVDQRLDDEDDPTEAPRARLDDDSGIGSSSSLLNNRSSNRRRSARSRADAEATSSVRRRSDRRAKKEPERRVLRVTAGLGSRLYSAYSVRVGDSVTGHAYSLDPLLSADIHASVVIPSTSLLIEGDFRFLPVSFEISDIQPPVTPSDPGGQFIDVAGGVGWRFDLASVGDDGHLTLTPLLGVDYEALLVDEQGPNTVVLAYSTFALGGGARLGVELPPGLGFDVEGKAGAIVGFSESPSTTGADGSGVRLEGRVRGRYWFLDQLGLQLAFRYAFRSIGTSGPGTRAAFENDPPLSDAEVQTEAFDFTAALVLSL